MKNKNSTTLLVMLILTACLVTMIVLILGCKVSQKNSLPVYKTLVTPGSDHAVTLYAISGSDSTISWSSRATPGSSTVSSTGFSILYGPKDTIPVGKLDTVSITLLYTNHCMKLGPNVERTAYSLPGYDVLIRKKHQDPPDSYCPTCSNHWEHVNYLDYNKTKLRDCITVWMAK